MASLSTSVITTQKLLLTPRLRQSIEILHMSSLDLMEFVQEQSRDNPLFEYNCESLPRSLKISSKRTADRNGDWWLNLKTSEEQSLERFLTEQLNEWSLDAHLYKICLFIIRSIDDKGYLQLGAEWISEHLKAPLPVVLQAVQIVQKMEPSGIAAATLEECLLLQLDRLDDHDPLIRRLIQESLADVAKRKFSLLAKKYGVEICEIQQAVNRISRLNPKPGAPFNEEKVNYIIPDITLIKANDKYELRVHEASLPRITVNSDYLDIMKERPSKEVSAYLGEHWKRLKELMDSIEHRKMTLLKVATVIFEQQQSFCQRGPSAIKPMAMRQVADILGIHESTVSRAVNQKYVMTPWGLYELKHFFHSSVKQSNGESVSSMQVKQKICEIVERENKSDPLSDQKIAERLSEDGLQVSRRTVTKYREQLNIVTATERKQYS